MIRLSIVLLALICMTVAAESAVIFEEGFDDQDDWYSQQDVNRSAGGEDVTWGMTRADTCTTHCPPSGWSGYTAAGSLWTDDRRLDTFVIDTAGARGGSGKGLTFNVESSDEIGNSSGTWMGGRIVKVLPTSHDEIYISMWVKFDANFTWIDQYGDSSHGQWKQIVSGSYECGEFETCTNYLGNTCDPSAHFPSGGGCLFPAGTILEYHNSAYTENPRVTFATRRAPSYSADNYEGGSSALQPSDSEWHQKQVRYVMNSAPGVADGIMEWYIDGVLSYGVYDVIWEMEGTSAEQQATGWNYVAIADNIHNSAYLTSLNQEMQIYIDDVVVSTTFVELDYVIGSTPVQAQTGFTQPGQVVFTEPGTLYFDQ